MKKAAEYVIRSAGLALCLLLGGCEDRSKASISMVGLNYTDEYIHMYKVNGYSAFNVSAYGGGGKFVCCVTVPHNWRPGLKATVRWTKDDDVAEYWKERIVEIPAYKKKDIGFMAVHFFPGDVVKVLVTDKSTGHPSYPYPDPTDFRKPPPKNITKQ